MARLSRRFGLSHNCHWPDPRSLATTEGVSIDVLSSGYLDVSVPRVRFLTPIYSGPDTSFRNPLPKAGPGTARQSETGLGGGFPHSDIHGSKLVRSSPWLFAAYHVLHRLRVPRHPPNALKALDRSHYQCPPQKNFQSVGCPGQRTYGHCSAHDDPCEIKHGPERPV